MKIKKKLWGGGGSSVRGRVGGGGGQVGCERRIEVFVIFSGEGWGGVRVDVNEELKCL